MINKPFLPQDEELEMALGDIIDVLLRHKLSYDKYQQKDRSLTVAEKDVVSKISELITELYEYKKNHDWINAAITIQQQIKENKYFINNIYKNHWAGKKQASFDKDIIDNFFTLKNWFDKESEPYFPELGLNFKEWLLTEETYIANKEISHNLQTIVVTLSKELFKKLQTQEIYDLSYKLPLNEKDAENTLQALMPLNYIYVTSKSENEGFYLQIKDLIYEGKQINPHDHVYHPEKNINLLGKKIIVHTKIIQNLENNIHVAYWLGYMSQKSETDLYEMLKQYSKKSSTIPSTEEKTAFQKGKEDANTLHAPGASFPGLIDKTEIGKFINPIPNWKSKFLKIVFDVSTNISPNTNYKYNYLTELIFDKIYENKKITENDILNIFKKFWYGKTLFSDDIYFYISFVSKLLKDKKPLPENIEEFVNSEEDLYPVLDEYLVYKNLKPKSDLPKIYIPLYNELLEKSVLNKNIDLIKFFVKKADYFKTSINKAINSNDIELLELLLSEPDLKVIYPDLVEVTLNALLLNKPISILKTLIEPLKENEVINILDKFIARLAIRRHSDEESANSFNSIINWLKDKESPTNKEISGFVGIVDNNDNYYNYLSSEVDQFLKLNTANPIYNKYFR